MSQFWSILIGAIVVISLIVLGFTFLQIQEQKNALVSDLEYRTGILAESFKESVEPAFNAKSYSPLQRILDKFIDKQRLVGLIVYDNKGNVVASSFELPAGAEEENELLGKVMDSNKEEGVFLGKGNNKIYKFVAPLRQDEGVVGALMVIQKADYIDKSVIQIWKTALLRLFLQIIVFALTIALLIRWFVFAPIVSMIKSIRQIRSGKLGEHDFEGFPFFAPLAKEISKISTSLLSARSAASEEARLRMEKIDTPWTAERLKEFIKVCLKDRKIFIVSNREPYMHNKIKNEIQDPVSVGGMVTAIEPVMEACGGVWLAQAMGNADRETADPEGKLQVPVEDPKYTLKRIWLTNKEQKGFYAGFSNEALWPLCHNAHTRPIFRKEDWQEYKKVNGKFTQALLAEIKDAQRPFILVQDFHLALMPQMIKKSRSDAQIGFFWHVPWPTAEIFNICPWHKEILEGMLGASVIGFHTQQYCNNFMATVAKGMEAIVDFEQASITFKGHLTYVKPFPISIAFTNSQSSEKEPEEAKKTLEEFGINAKYIGLGVDRMDYTKGILERFKGVEFFLDLYPEYRGEFAFLQIASPSREMVEKYRQFNEDVTAEAERINAKFSNNGWQPIILVKKHLSHKELYPLYRRANVCLVTSLHDGMNLVAKEFVSARDDESGVLILSQFAGASKDLKGAIIINPYSAEQTAFAIHDAFLMPPMQQHLRMKKMREAVKSYNVYRWSAEFIKAVATLD